MAAWCACCACLLPSPRARAAARDAAACWCACCMRLLRHRVRVPLHALRPPGARAACAHRCRRMRVLLRAPWLPGARAARA
eukprot:4754850-Pleurochrysis_carterae.AAC.1